jgi:hypothetical protein
MSNKIGPVAVLALSELPQGRLTQRRQPASCDFPAASDRHSAPIDEIVDHENSDIGLTANTILLFGVQE